MVVVAAGVGGTLRTVVVVAEGSYIVVVANGSGESVVYQVVVSSVVLVEVVTG